MALVFCKIKTLWKTKYFLILAEKSEILISEFMRSGPRPVNFSVLLIICTFP
jgi:hypothetical protein